MLVFFGGAVTRFIPWPAACVYVEKLRGRTVFMSEKNVFITMCCNGYGGRFFQAAMQVGTRANARRLRSSAGWLLYICPRYVTA